MREKNYVRYEQGNITPHNLYFQIFLIKNLFCFLIVRNYLWKNSLAPNRGVTLKTNKMLAAKCTCGNSISGICIGTHGCRNHLPSFTTYDTVVTEKRKEAIEFADWLSYDKRWFIGADETGAKFLSSEEMYERFLAQKRGDK